jgi:hypothetical protein
LAVGACCLLNHVPAQVEAIYSEVRGDWEAEANQYQSVAAAALEASTTDNEHQTIGEAGMCASHHIPKPLLGRLRVMQLRAANTHVRAFPTLRQLALL